MQVASAVLHKRRPTIGCVFISVDLAYASALFAEPVYRLIFSPSALGPTVQQSSVLDVAEQVGQLRHVRMRLLLQRRLAMLRSRG